MGSDSSKAGRNKAQQEEEDRHETFQYGPQPTAQPRANIYANRPSSGPQASYPEAKPRQVPPVPPRSSDPPPTYSSLAPKAPNYGASQATQSSSATTRALAPSSAAPRIPAPVLINNNPPCPPTTSTTIRQYCFGCNQITDHSEKNCPTTCCSTCGGFGHSPDSCTLRFCFICATYGHSDASCKAHKGILQPEVMHSVPQGIPKKAAEATPAPTAFKAKTVPPQKLVQQLEENDDNEVDPIELQLQLLRSLAKPARGKQIDLGVEMPKILEDMKSNKLPSYQNFKQQLCKNKPIKDVRSSMVNNKYLSDVKFIINGSTFYAHKMALITSSFLFYDHFHTKGKTELNVEFIDIETFEMLIKYCYSEQLKVTEENVLELLKGANQLQIRQVTNVCHGFITNLMNADSIFIIFEKAMEIQYEIFQKKCLDFIKSNEDKCFASKGFYAISLPSLIKVLQACSYSREKESEIVEKWNNGGMHDDQAQKTPDIKPPPAFPQKAAKPMPKAQKKKPQPPQQKIPPCPVPYNHEEPLIPDLMSIHVPDPNTGLPLPSPYSYEPACMPTYPTNPTFMPTHPIKPQRPFAKQYSQCDHGHNFGSTPNLASIPPNPLSAPNAGPKNKKPKAKPQPKPAKLIVVDDGDDDFGSVNGDGPTGTKIEVFGVRHKHPTEFSRLDLFCKRSMVIHEIIFSENLAARCGEVKVTISALDQGKLRDIHKRTVGINTGMKMNFIKFSRDPLKVYAGQKFSIKLNFDANVELINVSADSLLSNPLVELSKDSNKKYFNCVSSLTVSDMLAA